MNTTQTGGRCQDSIDPPGQHMTHYCQYTASAHDKARERVRDEETTRRMKGSDTKVKFSVYQEELKTRFTSHWDWDYLSRDELEELGRNRRQHDHHRPTITILRSWRKTAALSILLLAALLVGVDINLAKIW